MTKLIPSLVTWKAKWRINVDFPDFVKNDRQRLNQSLIKLTLRQMCAECNRFIINNLVSRTRAYNYVKQDVGLVLNVYVSISKRLTSEIRDKTGPDFL
ncbi:hypothetical protein BpHYR1_032202 [Brachionus plicatilis]|uniref:Uncharacterized protein n=1 Tax=Brachionus plicatilis TaxID=10195 RepID=A0A3M7Q6B3_BRAPC|nr:hypothetical protein BpHYR1_032202 [Brachionus plicatilis]